MGCLGAILAHLWLILGLSWSNLGLSWKYFEFILGILGACWGHLGASFLRGVNLGTKFRSRILKKLSVISSKVELTIATSCKLTALTELLLSVLSLLR